MRQPTPTFRAALKWLQPWTKTHTHGWQRRLSRDVLESWINQDDCEKLWAAIQAALKEPPLPAQFAYAVIVARLDCESLAKAARSNPKAEMLSCTEQLIGTDLSGALPVIHADFNVVGPVFERARATVQQAKLLSRKQMVRTHFIRTLSAGFVQWSIDGRPHDDLVRQLTDIAFGGKNSTEKVRRARGPKA